MHQSSSLDFKLVQRVCLLQQALDQALNSLDELKAQVKDKQWVETQLASTEKYANVQQQAIAHLKQQLTQFAEVQNRLMSVMGYRLNELIDEQQQEFNHLNIHFQQSHSELQSYLQYLGRQRQVSQTAEPDSEEYRLALEAEVVVARSMAVHLSQYLGLAKQHLDNLKAELSNQHLNLGHIIKTIQSMIADLEHFDNAKVTPPSSQSAFRQSNEEGLPCLTRVDFTATEVPDVEVLQATVRRQGLRIHELEHMLIEQVAHGTQVRQRYQAIAAERDYYKRELEKLRHAANTSAPTIADHATVDSPSEPPLETLPKQPPLPRRYRGRSQPSQPIQPLKLPDEPA